MNPIIVAIHLARDAHSGQQRKYNGRPYITHPMRVMSRYMLTREATEYGACSAVLHDTVEDTKLTAIGIEDALGRNDGARLTASTVHWLTNPSKQHPYLSRSARKTMDREHISQAPIVARRIKLIDRADNLGEMDVARDRDFARLYLDESKALLQALLDTDAELEGELAGRILGLERELNFAEPPGAAPL